MEQCDLVSSRLMAMEKTDDWAEANGVQSSSIVEVSAKNDDNVRTIFRKLFDQARRCTAASRSRVDVTDKGSPGLGTRDHRSSAGGAWRSPYDRSKTRC